MTLSQFTIKKSQLQGSIAIPASKSQTLRAILFGSLGQGKTIIQHFLHSIDTESMIQACRLFGASITVNSDKIEIEGARPVFTEDVIHAGNSGIVLRFCAAVGALCKNPIVITGDHSIRYQRPMKPLLEGLSQLGVRALSMRGDHYAPIIIQGPIQSGKATIDGEDSQPVSALLIASAFAEGPIEIEVLNPGEKPWVGLTLSWFDRLGIIYSLRENYHIQGHSHYEGFEYAVPGDFSSSAFPLAAALITNSEITLTNLDKNDAQGDKELFSVLQKMGAVIEEEGSLVRVKKSELHGIKVDINNFIDAITVLAVIGCFAEGETHLYNAAIAKKKECNRIHCIALELAKMGAHIMETDDGLIIRRSSLKGAVVDSHQDHRMALSLAIAGLGAEGKTIVNSIECITKTYSTFKRDFNALGANIQ